MTVHFLDDRIAIAAGVRNLFRDAKKIYCIVAFWGSGAEQLFNGMNRRKIQRTKIVCNLTMGGTNPNLIEDLRKKGIRIRHNPTLHSKVYWTDSGVVVGSANASANGLSLEGIDQDGWLEAAIFSDRKSEIDATNEYVQAVWNESREIQPQDMKNAHARWRRRRPFPTPSDDLAFIEALRQGRFSGRQNRIYIRIDTNVLNDPSHMLGQANVLKGQYVDLNQRELEAWEGFDEIPREQYIVCYFLGPRGGFQPEGIWYTLPAHCDLPGLNDLNYQFAYGVEEFEIGMTKRQRKQMTRIVRCVVANHREWLEQQGDCICLEQLLDPQVNDCLEQAVQNGY